MIPKFVQTLLDFPDVGVEKSGKDMCWIWLVAKRA